jgi:hypothetical protein
MMVFKYRFLGKISDLLQGEERSFKETPQMILAYTKV